MMLGGLLVSVQAEARTSAPLDTTGASPCEVRGVAIDQDTRGTHARSAPMRR
jgi:hypothetical protein